MTSPSPIPWPPAGGDGWNATGGVPDPNNNLANDVNQLIKDREKMAEDYGDIQTALTEMENALKSHNPDQIFMAMMIALYQIFPAIESYKQDNISQLADSENIASDIRTFITGAENSFNQTDGSGAQNLYEFIHYLNDYPVPGAPNNEGWISYLSDASVWGANNEPLDANDALNIINSIGTIKSEFGTNGADWGNFSNMSKEIQGWYTQGTGSSSGMPAPQIKGIQNALQEDTQAVSTLSTTTQTNEQFYTQEYNQILGIDNNLLQGEAQQNTNLVQNEKSN